MIARYPSDSLNLTCPNEHVGQSSNKDIDMKWFVVMITHIVSWVNGYNSKIIP